ncbi:MAG: MqnA/MqnD/SBP family protein [Dehalococcoidia bacterium]|nr:MqnA/MqnD/SBP family protein [Dehalococcoidia bacterium]
MGIVGGSQPLWRYVAQQRDQLLPSNYLVSFSIYPNESALKSAFLNKEVDVIATLPPQLAALSQAGVQAQYFSPIAWLKEGYPIIVPTASAIRSPADLAGAKLSTFPSDHPGLAYWQAFIQENYGFRLADQTSLVISQSPEDTLLNNEADAATVDAVAWGQLKGQGKYRAISDLATEWAKLSGSSRPLMYGGYVARKEWVDKNQKFVDDFTKANYQALQAYQKDQKAFLERAAAYADPNASSMTNEVLQSVADYLGMSQVAPERAYVTEADVADYARLFPLLAKTGYLTGSVPPAGNFFYLSPSRPKS